MWAQDGLVSLHGAHRLGKAAKSGGLVPQPTPPPRILLATFLLTERAHTT